MTPPQGRGPTPPPATISPTSEATPSLSAISPNIFAASSMTPMASSISVTMTGLLTRGKIKIFLIAIRFQAIQGVLRTFITSYYYEEEQIADSTDRPKGISHGGNYRGRI